MKKGSTLKATFLSFFLAIIASLPSFGQEQSIAREWNEQLLNAIRNDFARPTVHARNLFQVSAVMYDAWAAYRPDANPYLLGRTVGGFDCPFEGVSIPEDTLAAQREAISFAAYRLMEHRFEDSPGAFGILFSINQKMNLMGYDVNNTSTDYVNGGPAELGNYIADQMIQFGYQDGANEDDEYANEYYEPVNDSLEVEEPGNPNMTDPNRWQPISLTSAVDQAGNPINSTPDFLSPEWGNVVPFAMTDEDATTYNRNGNDYIVYHDPGPPAYIDTTEAAGLESSYRWGMTLVSVWQSHLDTADNVMWDISPASQGNIQDYPESYDDYDEFYDYFEGGDTGEGYDINPVTGEPYETQMVNRGDYARVLAEFWADGPSSETPPGHWFVIMNTVMDHPQFERKWMGEGEEMEPLEYDVRAYMALGGAMHDVAIASWSVKGWYDYVRPVSAIRYMADQGQSTDPGAPNYDPAGIPLVPGYIELVEAGDPLAGESNEHVNKIKLYTWKGHSYIEDTEVDMAGVGWILAENWWPYQRPTFVTPPFAGYVSGHSTYSRAAAELLTMMTGSEYFPGGMSNFVAEENEFLEFEEGPSETIVLQWAKYIDASDQCSLSRIWGGIHPPIDDINGRFMGMEIGPESFNHADSIFFNSAPHVTDLVASNESVNIASIGNSVTVDIHFDREMNTSIDPSITFPSDNPIGEGVVTLTSSGWSDAQTYSLTYDILDSEIELTNIKLKVNDAVSSDGDAQNVYLAEPFVIDTRRPEVTYLNPSHSMINDQVAADDSFMLNFGFDEACDTTSQPEFSFEPESEVSSVITLDEEASSWLNPMNYQAVFNVEDTGLEVEEITASLSGISDANGNSMMAFTGEETFALDTKNPTLANWSVNDNTLSIQDIGSSALVVNIEFDEEMNMGLEPYLEFTGGNPLAGLLQHNEPASSWQDDFSFEIVYDLLNENAQFINIGANMLDVEDAAGNPVDDASFPEQFIFDTERPTISSIEPSTEVVSDSEVSPGQFYVDVVYDEEMAEDEVPSFELLSSQSIGGSISYNSEESNWNLANTYRLIFDISDDNVEIDQIGISISSAKDLAGNGQLSLTEEETFAVDTRNPVLTVFNANTYDVTEANEGEDGFNLISVFDEQMQQSAAPLIEFISDDDPGEVLTLNSENSEWINDFTYISSFDVSAAELNIEDIDVQISAAKDMAGNEVSLIDYSDFFSISMTNSSLADIDSGNRLRVFPSPLPKGRLLNLNIAEPIKDSRIRVFNIDGKNVLGWNFEVLERGNHTLDMNDLSAGTYLVQVTGDNLNTTVRVVIAER